MPSKLILKKEDHVKIQDLVTLQGNEEYSVVTHRIHGEWKRSIHVFKRLPSTTEMAEYENAASKVRFRGAGKAETLSGAVKASEALYNKLISRVYDLPVGTRIYGEVTIERNGQRAGLPLNEEESRQRVPILVKKEALTDFVGQVFSESRLAEREGDEDDEVKDEKPEED
jgi:hypothetical protein